MEKSNGIKYLYAWLDRHPDVRAVVTKKRSFIDNFLYLAYSLSVDYS